MIMIPERKEALEALAFPPQRSNVSKAADAMRQNEGRRTESRRGKIVIEDGRRESVAKPVLGSILMVLSLLVMLIFFSNLRPMVLSRKDCHCYFLGRHFAFVSDSFELNFAFFLFNFVAYFYDI